MPSKLSIHLSAYPSTAFDVIERYQPGVVKVFNQPSEINIEELRRRTNAILVYREYTDLDYHEPADKYFSQIQNTFGKLRGRGLIWEGINEPIVNSIEDAKALNAWFVRFAEIWHAQGEIVAGFSWSTGNPTPDKLQLILPYITEAAAAVDVHAFHEYYSTWGHGQDWGRYRVFEEALPDYARKPVVITEAGVDDNGDPRTGGWRGKMSASQYLDILKQYDKILLEDPYVLGATIFQWGDGAWPSFDLNDMVRPLGDYIVSVGQGAVIPKPWPKPVFGPTVAFTATPDTIQVGQKSTLEWTVDHAQTVTLDGQAVPATGSQIVTPDSTTTYTLHIIFDDDTTKDLTAVVTVQSILVPVITEVLLSPSALFAGDVLNVSITVQNNSGDTLQTQGPQPGFAYAEGDTFASRGFPDIAGKFRVGIDFDGRTGMDHPYRWGLGAPLAPGQKTTITGTIQLKTPRSVNYWAGMVQERIAWIDDREGAQSITVKAVPPAQPFIAETGLTPLTLKTNELLNISITVQNNSNETLQTQGPEPGFVYNEGDTFSSRGFKETRDSFRVGIDFDGRTGVDHPYRWGLGAPLAPGQATTITGAIRLKTPRAIKYWAGLVREQIKWLQDRDGTQTITVQAIPPGAPTITQVVFTPTTLNANDLLNVSITVQNNSNQTLPTQNPAPGFAYTEGDTFTSRGFKETIGAFRVGVDFDGRTGIDHPYRWGLGAPLAPGESATVTGTVRLKTSRAINYWAGLVQEQVAWLQDRQGTQIITVQPPAPTYSFTATPTTITQGGSAQLEWRTENVRAVHLDGQGVAGNGTKTVSPTQTTTYTLHIVFLDGTARDLTATITVNPVPPVPTYSFSATPDTIQPGQSATLKWDADNIASVSLDGEIVPAHGTRTVTPAQTTTYTLHVILLDGSTKDLTALVTVSATPVTYSFTAVPQTIQPGGSATLEWQVIGAIKVMLDGEEVAAIDRRIVTPTQTTTYSLQILLPDGTTRDLPATVTVSTQPQPTRPPTVVITPQNVALLKTFPRPKDDNGRGLHFNIDLRDPSIARTVTHLQYINCKWTMIYAQDELQAKRAAKACWDVGIMPIVRIGKKVDENFDPVPYVTALQSINVPPYIQIYNEPGDDREWKHRPSNERVLEIFGESWAAKAALVFDAGGYPGLQVLSKEELDAAVNCVKANHRTDIFQRTWYSLHNYGVNHPGGYPYDDRNQQDHPGATIIEDEVSVLSFLAFAVWMKESIGFVPPIIGGEGGWEYGADNDNRYPKIEQPYHADWHAAMFDWYRTGIIGNGEPLPDYLFSITPWIEGGWGADDWWGGPLGDKTETIAHVQALPFFVRRFSWDQEAPPSYVFAARPTTIGPGDRSTLEWNVTGAKLVQLDGQTVNAQGSQVVTPSQTTTYTLHIVLNDNTTQDLITTVTVVMIPPFPELKWDARLDPLGIKLTRSTADKAWRLIEARYEDETQSNGDHDIFFKLLNRDNTPAPGIKVVQDWVNRDPSDAPASAITDANGEARIAMWAILHPEKQDGPYFAFIKDSPSDQVSGMGLPVNRHVNFVLTFMRS